MFVERFFRFVPKNDLKRALAQFNGGNYRRACRDFEEYLNRISAEGKSQDQEMVRMYMVESYVEFAKKADHDGDHADAAAALERAIQHQPRYADIHSSLGVQYLALGRGEEARSCFQNALAINPGYLRARIMLAKCYSEAGDSPRAIEELETSLSYAPAFLVDSLRELVRGHRQESSAEERGALFHRLLEERPTSAQISKQIALESIQNGDYDAAVEELKKALSTNPHYPDLHNMLGIAYANRGMTDDAVVEFETALKINPAYLKARLNLALALYEKGDKDESLRHLEMVLELDPANELAVNLLRELQPIHK